MESCKGFSQVLIVEISFLQYPFSNTLALKSATARSGVGYSIPNCQNTVHLWLRQVWHGSVHSREMLAVHIGAIDCNFTAFEVGGKLRFPTLQH